jgi:hypothetical protein
MAPARGSSPPQPPQENGREMVDFIDWYKTREPNNLASIDRIATALEEHKDTLGTLEKMSEARILSSKLPTGLVKRIKGFVKTWGKWKALQP